MQAEFETYEIGPKGCDNSSQLSQRVWDDVDHSTQSNHQIRKDSDQNLSPKNNSNLPEIELQGSANSAKPTKAEDSAQSKNIDEVQAKCVDDSCNQNWQREMDELRAEINADIKNLSPVQQNEIKHLQEEFPTKHGFPKSVIKYLYDQGHEELADKMIRLRYMREIMF